jgi:hypothetical protein
MCWDGTIRFTQSQGEGSSVITAYPHRPDWLDKEFELFEYVEPLVKHWDRTFKLKYREFRHRLQLISREHNEQIEGIQWGYPDRGDWTFKVDDDDWLNPDIVRLLRFHIDEHPSIDCWVWQGWKIQENIGLHKTPEDFYCLHSHMWRHDDDERKIWLRGHMHADAGFREQPVIARINTDEVLHLWNNHPGSTCAYLYRYVMPWKVNQGVKAAIVTLEKLIRQPPPKIEWALRCLKKQLELLQSL